ncbi:MAG: (Fe-S)-binding protein [Magnetococcales bacterium]|nr:(Fe-S)-binding protein [Magnetococcales bacterium]
MRRGSGPFANADLCTQCGYCLPVCPTYRVENNELHGPRGRVSLILALQSGAITPAEAAAALDHCLLCRACHAACPAGVRPAKLALALRGQVGPRPTVLSRLLHRITNSHRMTARLAGLLASYQRSGLRHVVQRRGWLHHLPTLERLDALVPRQRSLFPLPSYPNLPLQTDCPRIGLLAGCIGRLFYPAVAPAAARLLAQQGGEVILLDGFGCCGAPFRESGARQPFLRQARRTLDAFVAAGPLQAVVCDSTVCAVTGRSYARALDHDPAYAAVAEDFARKLHTLSQFLASRLTPLTLTAKNPGFAAVTYHDHCQTRFGLGIIEEPRWLLATLPMRYHELAPKDPFSSEGCCGAGGDYQLRHPERSQQIRTAKLAAIQASGAELVVGENPGCLLHIATGLEQADSPVRVCHLAELLWAACAQQQPTH